MKKEISKAVKFLRILSIISLLIGVILMVFMITVEDEPGALPLLLILIGSAWFTINQFKIKKYHN